MPTRRQFLAALGTTALTTAVWIPSLSTVFAPRSSTLAADPEDPVINGLMEAQLRFWSGSGELSSVRAANPEWDFMGRTFAMLALLTAAHRRPELGDRVRSWLDPLLEATLRVVDTRGMHHFMLPYGRGEYLNPSGGSLFVDGELLLVCATRQLVFQDGRFEVDQRRLARRVRQNMDAGPLGHGESYPDECWAFCNSFAALGLQRDRLSSGRHHRRTVQRYLEGLPIDAATGMLQSEYTYAGRPMDGPEGSSIHLTTTLLEQVAPGAGATQYALARPALQRRFLGFGYSREWPPDEHGVIDIDSGPVIPGFDASPGASGMAVISAAAFGDHRQLRALLAALWATAFPTWEDGALRFAASNVVGDAAILFGLIHGWELP